MPNLINKAVWELSHNFNQQRVSFYPLFLLFKNSYKIHRVTIDRIWQGKNMIFILTICCNFLLLIYSMVNCHTGSLEIRLLDVSPISRVNCHTGSLEIAGRFGQHKQSVNCHTGSLEKNIAKFSTRSDVNCHTGSLEMSALVLFLAMFVNCHTGSLETHQFQFHDFLAC